MGSLLGGNSTGARWAEWNLAKALDAHLLKVRVTVPLAIVKTSGGLLSGGASVKVEPLPRIARDVTRFTFRRERAAARVRLDRHLLLPADLLTVETVSKQADNTGGSAGDVKVRVSFTTAAGKAGAIDYPITIIP